MIFDSATIAAFVDGELDDIASHRIARAAEADPELAAKIARHRALKAELSAHFAPVLDEAVPERLRALLAADERVDTSLAARRDAKRARFAPLHWGALAASLALGLTIGLRPWAPVADVSNVNGALVASGKLAASLETQLASNQPDDAPVRIGLSFRDRDGRICRSFESQDLDGIGCRENESWILERIIGGETRGDYRQASSGRLMADAAEMMIGEPLDAAGERAARADKWNP